MSKISVTAIASAFLHSLYSSAIILLLCCGSKRCDFCHIFVVVVVLHEASYKVGGDSFEEEFVPYTIMPEKSLKGSVDSKFTELKRKEN